MVQFEGRGVPKTHAQINIKFEKFNALYENFEIID